MDAAVGPPSVHYERMRNALNATGLELYESTAILRHCDTDILRYCYRYTAKLLYYFATILLNYALTPPNRVLRTSAHHT